MIQKHALLPSAKRELEQLQHLTGFGEDCTYEKRKAFTKELAAIRHENHAVMDEVKESEALL